jgi:hypothetical protein
LNPSSPKVDNFVLPPPTLRRIREIKSANFIALQSRRWSAARRAASQRGGSRLPYNEQGRQAIVDRMTLDLSNRKLSPAIPDRSLEPGLSEIDNHQTRATRTLDRVSEESLSQKNDAPLALGNSRIETLTRAFERCSLALSLGDENVELTPDIEAVPKPENNNESDSDQEFARVSSASSLDISSGSLLVAFEMMKPRQTRSRTRKSIRGGDVDICTLRQVASDSPDRRCTGEQLGHQTVSYEATNRCEISKVQASDEARRHSRKESFGAHPEPVFGASSRPTANCSKTLIDSETMVEESTPTGAAFSPCNVEDDPFLIREDSKRPRSFQQERVRAKLQRQSSPAKNASPVQDDCAIGHSQRPENRKRAHRLARLVDGNILSASADVCKLSRVLSGEAVPESCNSRRSSLRTSWSRTPEKQRLRHSFVERVRSVFQKDHDNKQGPPASASMSFSAFCGKEMSESSITSHNNDRSSLSTTRPAYNFSVDGAFDERPASPPKSPVNLNKALPAKPTHLGSNAPYLPRADTRTPSLTYSQDTTYRPSTVSTVSSSLSQSSSKKGFRHLTRNLLHVDMDGNSIALSPINEPDIGLDPLKFDPLKSPKLPRSYVFFVLYSMEPG